MPAVKEVLVPDLGDFSDVDVIEVLVKPGDVIAAEDSLITLESDKATMDVPAPNAGVVTEVKTQVGDKVSEGSLILLMEPKSSTAAIDTQSQSSPPAPDQPKLSAAAAQKTSKEPTELPQPKAQPIPARTAHAPPSSLPPPVERAGEATPHASPGVRRFARELGAELNQIRGTGHKGRILKEDVQTFIKAALTGGRAATEPVSGLGIPPIPEIDFSKFGEVETEKLSRIKKISGAHLHRAWLNVPHVTHHDEADITELEEFRQSLKEEAGRQGVRVTVLVFIMKAVVAALKTFPNFNTSLTPDGQGLVFKKYFHIGIAVDTPKGLVVPVFRDVDQKGVLELADEMGQVSARARDGKLAPGDMQGGCISISSVGGIGGSAFTPIVNTPEVAILGVTRAKTTPVWNGHEFVPRLILPLDLSYDHRVIDGAEAARFMSHLCQSLADARRLLL
ncbi:MAG: dihydrolipoyllysine-residue acetyltransferase [Gammaproteobacteria bacterium]|nr:dihydrolipoyllysine-residue acetyltransferase [Gammaproteobacteria bacterium]